METGKSDCGACCDVVQYSNSGSTVGAKRVLETETLGLFTMKGCPDVDSQNNRKAEIHQTVALGYHKRAPSWNTLESLLSLNYFFLPLRRICALRKRRN